MSNAEPGSCWYELHPGFILPRTLNPTQFPPYTDFDPELPDPLELIVLPWRDPIPSWGWAAWMAYERSGKCPRIDYDLLQAIAWRKYGSARYTALVPYWRRTLAELHGEIDDIEDQISTLVWLAELLGRKILPIPPGVLGAGAKLSRSLDAAGDTLTLGAVLRSSKSEFRDRQRTQRKAQREARSALARAITWLSNNYGRILEAAQATGTWFDTGIILGPIFAYIEEGIWGLAQQTLDNYLVAADALLPGYSEDFYRNAELLSDNVELWMADAFEEIFYQNAADAEWVEYYGI